MDEPWMTCADYARVYEGMSFRDICHQVIVYRDMWKQFVTRVQNMPEVALLTHEDEITGIIDADICVDALLYLSDLNTEKFARECRQMRAEDDVRCACKMIVMVLVPMALDRAAAAGVSAPVGGVG